MGRTRNKKTKAITTLDVLARQKEPPSSAALLEKAQSLIVQCDYELAKRFIERALQADTTDSTAREMLGVVQLELGDLDDAKQTFESLVPPSSTAPPTPPTSAFLYLAQLVAEDDPHSALRYYQTAVDILQAQLKGKARASDDDKNDETETKQTAVRALISMVEIWMDPAQDLCFDPVAEKTCEELLQKALVTDPGNAEATQMLASVRMSQQRPDEAKQLLDQAWSVWKDFDVDDPRLPSLETRLALVRLFLELALFAPALLVLQGVMAVDDQEVEAWYLEGWCFFLMAEQSKTSGEPIEGLTWEELAKDAYDCLQTCKTLHTNQDHPDRPLLEHAEELMHTLDGFGITPSPADEEDDEWEEADSDDVGSDDDIEMS
ncbi:TPR-like protein [Punctularia strigosozonata HHB-11173 SS5]|uniref:TPR-like protein n=1 Tax=Punctularia strigosozonata (strain HHB-11173) TaxID=741275 RepID=R7S3W3_PUNST|nr:TPR-like protein [Punctularia strigosozonata HHB-11173 SS5]EIN04898.1 TPR-like protein [Punctularia strigosozonata HHB-11173 SS5]